MRRPVRNLLLVCSMLAAGVAGAAVNTYSTSPALVVPDVSTVMSTINVPDTGTLNSITVNLTLEHPQTADVLIRLTDPSGGSQGTRSRGRAWNHIASSASKCDYDFAEAPPPAPRCRADRRPVAAGF